jgi:Gas vesicle synthesis protein GvpO
MTERRKIRSGADGRTSTRSREASDRDEREMLETELEALDEDELLDPGEPGEADETRDADEPDAADEDEMLDGEPDAADQDESPAHGQRRPTRRRRPAMTAGQAAKAALRQIAELTAKQPEGITEVESTEDGRTVGIELVEDQRIPSSADILATYETTIDADGELLSYRRVKRYARGRGDPEDV